MHPLCHLASKFGFMALEIFVCRERSMRLRRGHNRYPICRQSSPTTSHRRLYVRLFHTRESEVPMTVRSQLTLFVCSATVGLLASSLAQPASAEELDRSHVPADAKWLVHVDYDALSDTEVVQKLRDSNPHLVQGVRDWIKGRYGIDTQEGLHGLTMYSRDYKAHTGTLLMYAEYDRDKVEAELKSKESLQTTKDGETTFYTVTVGKHDSKQHAGKHDSDKRDSDKHDSDKHDSDKHESDKQDRSKSQDESAKSKDKKSNDEKSKDKKKPKETASKKHDLAGGKQMTVILLKDKVLFASSVEHGKEALKLLDGNGESLEEGKSPLVDNMPEETLMYGAAIELGKISQHELLFPVLRQHSRVTWAVGRKDDKLYEKTCLVAESDDVAEKMQRVAEGAVAYKKLWMIDSDASQKLLEDVTIKREGKELKIEWEGEPDTVHSALVDFGKYVSAWKQAMRK